jgi:hypothetical protein
MEEFMTEEDGIGSRGRESENHFAAIRKNEGVEAERRALAAAAALPYIPENEGTDKFEQMLALISDPAAAKARYTALVAATEEAKRATDEAVAARQALDAQKREHQAALDDAQSTHQRRIARESAEHAEKCEKRERALAQREGAMQAAEDRLRALTEAAEKARGDFERRLASLNAAAAAA